MLVTCDAPTEERFWSAPALPRGELGVACVSAGDQVPLDLQLMHDLLSRAGGVRLSQQPLASCLGLTPPQVLVLADDFGRMRDTVALATLDRLVDSAGHVFMLGGAAQWWSRSTRAHGRRVALHWTQGLDARAQANGVVASGALFEVQGRFTSCCGSAATLDLGICLLRESLGEAVAQQVQQALCLATVRRPDAAQRQAPAGGGPDLTPRLAEALALMKANIEEPLTTEDIASLVGLSRRQLERLFRRQFDTVPSRYYLEMRLQRARLMLTEARHSLLEIGLMCGFSSGSHFSSSYTAVFGTTPREERQRVLGRSAPPVSQN